MLIKSGLTSLLAGLLMAVTTLAQTPANAPAGSTGQCRDGSYWSGAVKKGACRGHKGVQDWYGSTGAATNSPALANSTSATAAAPAVALPAPASAAPKNTATQTSVAPGGGAGQVWVNKNSKVYHCQSDRWYGKTKSGAYMTEADAASQGNRPDHGKPCH